MNKEEFLKRLEQLLSDISEEERADALAFYRSYFEDAGIGNEASILEELESPEKVAEVIKKDLGVSEAADVETHEADVRGEKVEAHTEETSGNGQKTETGTDDPYMNSLYLFREFLGEYDSDRVKFMVTQKVGDEYEEGMKLLRELYEKASKDERVDVPLSELRVGLKCGGSDGFSGITANPLLGMFSDFLIAQGGTSVLTEVPEMFGAETILMNRCRNKELFEETVKLINDFKEYFLSHGEPVGENPSPGNKAGGISTLEDKALGCTQKCGKSYVDGVLPYGERLQVKGLNLLSAPGNDLVAATALASCGCHMVLFTTGRGTPFGTYVPTMKISTNSTLAKNKPGWIDFNAGVILENEPMEKTCERFIDYIIRVASGEFVNNEKKGYKEIAIFKTGVTL